MQIIKTSTKTITDNGINYEIDFAVMVNSAANVANGAASVLPHVTVYRLRKDGSRGLQLKNLNARLEQVVKATEADDKYTAIKALLNRRINTCGRGFRDGINREMLAVIEE